MDPTTSTIWITPVVKTTYTDLMYFAITSHGKSFRNPTTVSSFVINTLTIRYYTWPDGQ